MYIRGDHQIFEINEVGRKPKAMLSAIQEETQGHLLDCADADRPNQQEEDNGCTHHLCRVSPHPTEAKSKAAVEGGCCALI